MPAKLWSSLGDGFVRCEACAQRCVIGTDKMGKCCVRGNKRGVLLSLVESLYAGISLEPVERRSLYHFLPGSNCVAVQGLGCSLACSFCPEFESALLPQDRHVLRGQRVALERLARQTESSRAACVVFCGGEPGVSFESVYEAAGRLMTCGLKIALRTNGYASRDCLMDLYRRVQAASVSLMAFSDKFYQEQCGGRLQPVLDGLKTMHGIGWWLEISTPVIAGLNDGQDEFRAMARFIRDELGPETPWHLHRFAPTYKLAYHAETPLSRMEQCRAMAHEEGLLFVYTDETPESTLCPQCGGVIVHRAPQTRAQLRAPQGICPQCGQHMAGIWS